MWCCVALLYGVFWISSSTALIWSSRDIRHVSEESNHLKSYSLSRRAAETTNPMHSNDLPEAGISLGPGGGNVVSEGRQTPHPGRGPRGGDPSHTGSLQLACAVDTARPRSPRFRNPPRSCRNSLPLLPRGGPNIHYHILGRFQIRHELDEVLSTHRGLDGDRTNYGGLGSASLDRGGHATLLSDVRLSSTLDLAPRRWSGPGLHLVDGMRL